MNVDDEELYHYSDEDITSDEDVDGGIKSSSDFGLLSSNDGNKDTDDIDLAIENEYYNAKQLRDTSASEALAAFEEVLNLEKNNNRVGSWSYKALKQLVKMNLLRTNINANEILKYYDRLLQCVISGAVTQDVFEKDIVGLLDRVSHTVSNRANSNNANGVDRQTVKEMYLSTLAVAQPDGQCPNERIWFKTSLKLGQLLYENNDLSQLQILINELLKAQQQDDSSVSRFMGPHLLEIYALQGQLYSRKNDIKNLRELLDRALLVAKSAVPHPRTLAVIQEIEGKMHLVSKEFEAADISFFRAFKSYDEASDPNRLRCLKYLVMASMLHASTINPFDSQEARFYDDDPEIVAMTNLVQAFRKANICEFEGILKKNEGWIMEDEFIREQLVHVLRTIRSQALQNVISPYTRVRLEFIARELNAAPIEEVESLLLSLIENGKLNGFINQMERVLIIRRVSFGEVEIRTYSRTIGDNPGSMCGAPVTLSWDFDTERVLRLQLEEYEKYRGPPRSGKALFLDREVREAILLECGFPMQDIIVAANKATIARLKRRKTIMTLKYAPLHEALEKVTRKVTRIRWIFR